MEIELCIPDPNPYIANGLPKQTPIFRDHPEAKHLLIVHGRQNLATLSIDPPCGVAAVGPMSLGCALSACPGSDSDSPGRD